MESKPVSLYEDALSKMPNSDNISNGNGNIKNLKDNANNEKKLYNPIKTIQIENGQSDPLLLNRSNRSNRSIRLAKYESSKENGKDEISEYSSVNDYMPKFEKELDEPCCKNCKCIIF